MSYSRFARCSGEVLLLTAVFALAATISTFACDVTGRIYTQHIDECMQIPNVIYKMVARYEPQWRIGNFRVAHIVFA